MKYSYLTFISLLIVTISPSAQETGDESKTQFGEPSIEKMLENSKKMPTESDIVNQEILKALVGFPIDLSEIDADENAKNSNFRSALNHEYSSLSGEILKMYWSGSLVKEKRDAYLQSIFTEEFRKKSHFPIQGFNNLMAVYYRNLDEIDSLRVLTAIFVSGQLGAIQDIKPYLEYATVFVGDFKLATGMNITYSTSMDMLPDIKLTPSQRIKFWPSACAIFNNTNTAVPKLLDAVKDKNLREDLRLRAAAFINTIDPSVIDQKLLENLEPAMAEKVQCIKKYSLKWRHMLDNVCEDTSERDNKLFNPQIPKHLKNSVTIPPNLTVGEARKMEDEYFWGKY
ncbi:MAG: hypothetical protein AB1656_23230 [Candidatus Omnitrophota bacterium]